MAESISNLAITVALDGTKAESGLNRVADKVEDFGKRMSAVSQIGAGLGSILGAFKFGVFAAAGAGAVGMLKNLAASAKDALLAEEALQFSQVADQGALMQQPQWLGSMTGQMALLSESWDNLILRLAEPFEGVIKEGLAFMRGVFEGVAVFAEEIARAFGWVKDDDGNFENLQNIFKVVRDYTIDIAKALTGSIKYFVDGITTGLAELRKITNPGAFKQAWNEVLLDLGLRNRRQYNQAMRANAQEFANNQNGGALAGFQAGLENFSAMLGNLQNNLEEAKGRERQPRLKVPAMEQAPENIFAAALERGSVAEWESRMRDQFSAETVNIQEQIADNTNRTVFILEQMAQGVLAAGQVVMPGLLEFGKGF